jgi:glycosyltransferase involved in cell wall biosynthesis
MKIAIVHDYLIDFGGAERVLLSLHEIYPEAPIYVLTYRPKLLGNFKKNFKNIDVRQSQFGKLPFAEKLISPFRFLLPLIWQSFNLKSYDLIISSSSWAVTKGFEKKKKAVEICYCHTPPRYLYGYDTSRKFKGFLGSLVAIYSTIINHFMRIYDFKQAQKVNFFIANSKEVALRIEKFYRRNSKVIYPPVEIQEEFKEGGKEYYLTGGRMTYAKNFDLIIKTFNKLKLPLKIYGDGILRKDLEKIANKNIEFVGKIADSELIKLYINAKAFVLAQKDEDFGITCVEAQGCGCPVIAYKGGGYLESVIENKTGVFFDELGVDSLVETIKRFEKTKFDSKECIKNAKKFNKERFREEMLQFINEKFEKS